MKSNKQEWAQDKSDECWKLLRTDYGDPTEPYKVHWR